MARISVTVNGSAVTMTDDEMIAIVRDRPDHPISKALKTKFNPSELSKADFSAALTAEQRTIVGNDPVSAWTHQSVIGRLKSQGTPAALRAAAEMEIAIIAQQLSGST